MKRWLPVFVIMLVIAVIATAGYLGMRSSRAAAQSGTEAPTTVEVTRGGVQTTVTAPGHLVATHEVTLGFGVAGKVTRVDVRPGEQVSAGAALAQLDTRPLHDQVEAAQADLDLAEARLQQLRAGPSAAQLAAAELAVASAEAQLRQLLDGPSPAQIAAAEAEVAAARKELEYLSSLPDPRAVAQAQAQFDKATVALQLAQAAYDAVASRPDVAMLPQALALQRATIDHRAAKASLDAASGEAAPATLAAAQARLTAAQANLAQLMAGPGDDELALAEGQRKKALAELDELTARPSAAELQQAEAAVQAAQRALQQARVDLQAATLRAPFDGVVLVVSATPGQLVAVGTVCVRLADPCALEVETSVIEEDLPLVQVGQTVELFFDAAPELQLQGEVARIVPQRLPGDRPLYPVYIAVDELPGSLVAGMTADASIVVDSRQDALRLPRALVRARADGTATIQVWTGTEIEQRSIQVGLRGDTYIEILSGLAEGQQVVAQ